MKTRLAILACIPVFLLSGVAYAAPGAFDGTFGGGDGIAVVTKVLGTAYATAAQPDGKVIVAGTFAKNLLSSQLLVLRLTPRGALDTTFGGGDGVVRIDLPGDIDVAYDVAVQTDGRIVAVGTSESAAAPYAGVLAAVRLTPRGALDTTFHGGGIVVSSFPWADAQGNAVAVQPDGTLVIAGTGSRRGTDLGFVLRLLPSGAPDTTFSRDGKAIVDTQGTDRFNDVAVSGTGRIVAGGTLRYDGVGQDLAAVAFTSEGRLDTTFSGDGIAAVTTNAVGEASTIAIGPHGAVVLGGTAPGGDGTSAYAVARFTKRGARDGTFSGDGLTIANVTSGDDDLQDVVVQPDGKILCVGTALKSGTYVGVVLRLRAGGRADGTFGEAKGIQSPGADTRLFGGALDPQGRLLFTGFTTTTVHPFAARLLTA